MATTIEAGFDEFLSRLRTKATETEAAKSHRASIAARLQQDFGMTSFFRTGSLGNGTNVAGFSDVDYFAVIPTAKLKRDSGITLGQVAAALRGRFPQTPNIRVNAPGVQVPFGLDGAEATEIVPVDETGRTLLGFRQFDIPDGAGGWKFSAPDSHNAYVSEADRKLDGKVKPLIRLVKAWKFRRSAPIRSFYLEIRVAEYAFRQSSICPDIDLAIVLRNMLDDGLADLADPRFPNDNFILRACSTEAQRQDALSKLQNAVLWAAEAFQHKQAGRLKAGFDRWSLVFNHTFPAYSQ